MISVLHAPLFSAVDQGGNNIGMGMLELLSEAQNLADIKSNSCTGKLALLRLCIAFLSDAYRLRTLDDRAELLEAGRFDREMLRTYVAMCEAKGVSFLLDDARRPFMQAGYDECLDAKARKSVAKIMFDVPGGNNHIHLDHRHEDDHEADAAGAFEAMLETYLFCPAGLSGASNVNNTPPVYALVYGCNLFETLALNMVAEKEIINVPYGHGEAVWLRDETIIPGTKTVEMSLIKALTWQPRRLTLQWDEDGMVRNVLLQNGLNFQGNGLWRDPHVIFRKNKDGGLSSVKPDLDRELWRDAGNLVNAGAGLQSSVPLQNLSAVWEDAPAVLDIELIGMATNNEAILGRVNERLKLPVQLFRREDLAGDFQRALDITESMARALDGAVKWQFCHQEDKKRRSVVAQLAGEVFLHRMRQELFGPYLEGLISGVPFGEGHSRYLAAMWETLDKDVLRGIVEQTGSDVPALKRQNAVRAKVRKEFCQLTGKE